MKDKIKKILTTSLVSAVTLTTVSTTATKLLPIKNLDTVKAEVTQYENINQSKETIAKGTSKEKVGKIVETSILSNDGFKTYTGKNGANYLSATSNIENNIDTNNEENNSMSLFVLSESPYIALSSDDKNSRFNMYINFSRNIGSNANFDRAGFKAKMDSLSLKRSILMVYTNELYSGNINLSNDAQAEIETQLNTLDNTSNDSLSAQHSSIDGKISAIDSVINILEDNLTENSIYYGKNLADISNTLSNSSLTTTTEHKELADRIVSVFELQSSTNASNETNAQTLGLRNTQTQNSTNNSQTSNLSNNMQNNTSNTNQQNSTSNNLQNNTNNQNNTLQNQSSIANTQTTLNRNRPISNNNIQTQNNNTNQNTTTQISTNQNNNTSNIDRNTYITRRNNNIVNRSISQNNSTSQATVQNQNGVQSRNGYNRTSNQITDHSQNNNINDNNSNANTQAGSNDRTMRADRTQNNNYISENPRFQNNRPSASRTPYNQTQYLR